MLHHRKRVSFPRQKLPSSLPAAGARRLGERFFEETLGRGLGQQVRKDGGLELLVSDLEPEPAGGVEVEEVAIPVEAGHDLGEGVENRAELFDARGIVFGLFFGTHSQTAQQGNAKSELDGDVVHGARAR